MKIIVTLHILLSRFSKFQIISLKVLESSLEWVYKEYVHNSLFDLVEYDVDVNSPRT